MDEIEVMNSALMLLKDRRITSFDDGSERAALAKIRYALCRDSVLESHVWNFASVRVALSADPVAPAFGFTHKFLLPTNPWCIKVRDVDLRFPGAPQGAWEVGLDENGRRVILSNAETLKIRYTARVEDLNLWAPLAVTALTYLLASDFAGPITGQNAKTQQFQQSFKWAIGEAMTSDAREGTPLVIPAPVTLTAIRR
jgi:hypothetical protein